MISKRGDGPEDAKGRSQPADAEASIVKPLWSSILFGSCLHMCLRRVRQNLGDGSLVDYLLPLTS